MKKYISIIGLVFLVGCSIVVWTNYVNPCPEPKTIFVDTCNVDSVIVDSVIIDTITKCQTDE